ncbi:heme NO-binding domain-containing protein [Primorskyibacter flagellatus]|uniref:heme NO-binding domain-containing protein n=1 Tax=Primorskyibacter flagellatus TaxID=1387277 RepID=UPI001E440E33|nr:heme NO-binding domain-containing protein [Primorskyibacter flagellatus]
MATHGLMLRAVQCFMRDTYGPRAWASVIARSRQGVSDFEAMLNYDDALADALLTAISAELGKPLAVILEDIGTYLVSDPNVEALRRLLRFAGISYEDFLLSLEDLPGRARLAVSDLILPRLDLRAVADGCYVLRVSGGPAGFGHVMVGILRAMADDYGALVMLDHHGTRKRAEEIGITMVEAAYASGRVFDLGAAVE